MSLPALLGGDPVADADTYPSWPQWGEREREELLAHARLGRLVDRRRRSRIPLRGRVRALPGRRGRPAVHERDAHARGGARGLRDRRGRRGDRAGHDVRRQRERRALGQRDAGDRRRRRRHALHRRGRRRGGDHAADARDHRRARRGRRRRPRPARAALRGPRAAPDRGLRARPRLAVARARRRQLRLVRQLLDAAGQAHDRGRGRGADRQRPGAARGGLELRRLRPRARALVLPPRHASAPTSA